MKLLELNRMSSSAHNQGLKALVALAGTLRSDAAPRPLAQR